MQLNFFIILSSRSCSVELRMELLLITMNFLINLHFSPFIHQTWRCRLMQIALMDDWDFCILLSFPSFFSDNNKWIIKEERLKKEENIVFWYASTYSNVGFSLLLSLVFHFGLPKLVMQFVYCYYYRKLHSFIHPVWNWWQYLYMYMRYLFFPLHNFLFFRSRFLKRDSVFLCTVFLYFMCLLCLMNLYTNRLMRKNNSEERFQGSVGRLDVIVNCIRQCRS